MKTGKEIIDLNLEEVPTLVHPFIPRKGTISLAGSSDLGKSYLLLQLMLTVIKGEQQFLGFPLNTRHRRCIYVSTEDDDHSLCPRLKILAQDPSNHHLLENLKVLFDTRDLLERLDQVLSAYPCDVVTIDTFSDIYGGDMNQANRVRSFLQLFKELANKHDTMIIFNHHCGKKNDYRPPHKDNLLGSQGFESSMRAVIELRKDFNSPQKRHLCIVKGNYIGEEYKNASFVLDFDYQSGFINTGWRSDFARLVKSDADVEEQASKAILQEKIVNLKKEGLTYTAIADKLAEEGEKISRATVARVHKAVSSRATPIEDERDERDPEAQENGKAA
jgi:archaellum biogenesis ATPase FlaH